VKGERQKRELDGWKKKLHLVFFEMAEVNQELERRWAKLQGKWQRQAKKIGRAKASPAREELAAQVKQESSELEKWYEEKLVDIDKRYKPIQYNPIAYSYLTLDPPHSEPIRPEIETWLLNWISSEPLRRSDFFETETGNCRIVSRLCKKLSETGPVWRKLVSPWAEYVAQTLWSGSRSKHESNMLRPTRLTQQRRTEAKGRVWAPRIRPPKSEHLCPGCGKTIQDRSRECARCAVHAATKNMLDAARIGRLSANGPKAQAKRAIKARKNALAQHSWKESDQSAWLTEDFYTQKIQPLVAQLSSSLIARHISVSRWYAGRIREGYRPHPRHRASLAQLVGLTTFSSSKNDTNISAAIALRKRPPTVPERKDRE